MSKKRKRKGRATGLNRFEIARREMAKGNAKAALKDATLCYRDDASPDNRQLLEQAYVARITQLHKLKLSAEARAVLARLLELDPISPEVREKIPHLQIIVGDSAIDASTVFEQHPELLEEQVDRAVLDPREAIPDYRDTRLHVSRVRDAFTAIERGGDDAALGLLRDIPRSSPLGDWTFFLRGLIAFYASDGTRMHANWRRLDPLRPAYRIAQTLLVGAGELNREDVPIDVSGGLHKLEIQLQTDPAADSLKELNEAWRDEDLSGFFRSYRRFRQRFSKTHGPLLDAIVECIWKRAVRDDDVDALDQLEKIGPAPALDPHWYRVRAILSENSYWTEYQEIESYWFSYIEEIPTLTALHEDEQSIAEGLVYRHLARHLIEQNEIREYPFFSDAMEPDESVADLDLAIGYYERSIQLCPELKGTYKELANVHDEMGAPWKSAVVMKQLVRQDPNDYDAQCWLADYYISQKKPGQSEQHVKTASRLKPRDPQTVRLCWNQSIAMARALAVRNKLFEAARKELDAAMQSMPADVPPYTIHTLRAAVEFKARNVEAGRQYLQSALNEACEPVPVWMMMCYRAVQFRLSRDLLKDWKSRYVAEIKKKPKSQTAGRLAKFLISIKANGEEYTGLATQKRLFHKYLKRTKRMQWIEQDLVGVCEYLVECPNQDSLLGRLIARGVRKFPDNAFMHFLAGREEMKKGPALCDLEKAERHLDRVLDLAGQSTAPREQQMVATAKLALGLIQDTRDRFESRFYSSYEEEDDDETIENNPFFSLFDEDEECMCDDCRRQRELFSSLEGVDPQTLLDEMQRVLPERAMQLLEIAARRSNRSVLDMLSEVINKELAGPHSDSRN